MTSILQATRKFVIANFEKEDLSERLIYHDLTHIHAVVAAAEEIASNSGCNEDEIEIVLIAAWFHDVGYLKSYLEHEEQGRLEARDFLQAHHYPPAKLVQVENCIMATKLPQSPGNKLEEIICDADMVHLSSPYYLSRADALRREFQIRKNSSIKKEDWLSSNLRFLAVHRYFTDYARATFGPRKEANRAKIRKLLGLEEDQD